MPNPVKILFIIKAPVYEPQIGIMQLSAVLKKQGHQTDLVIINKHDTFADILKQIKTYNPDIIAYSLISGNENFFLDLNKKLKKGLDFIAIFGGPHTTFFPEFIQQESVDIICRGEGEYAFLELVNKLQKGQNIKNIKNLWIKKDGQIYKNDIRNLIENLDSLPYPDREIFYQYRRIKQDPIKHFIATRGCPYNCTYCFNHSYNRLYQNKGNPIRLRSVNNIINEIKNVIQKYPAQMVYFQDDTLILNKKWIKEFTDRYKEEINLPIHCHVRANLVDEEIIKSLKRANCTGVHMAIESGNDRIRNEILRRNMSREEILKAANLLKKYKIKLMTQNILGLPTSKLKDDINTLKLNIKCQPTYVWCSIFMPYPGTNLSKFCLDNNLIDGKINGNFFDTCVLKIEHRQKRVGLQKWFAISCNHPFLLYSKILYLLISLNNKHINKLYKKIHILFRKYKEKDLYEIEMKWDKPVYKKG